jgi:hypothetical protein
VIRGPREAWMHDRGGLATLQPPPSSSAATRRKITF